MAEIGRGGRVGAKSSSTRFGQGAGPPLPVSSSICEKGHGSAPPWADKLPGQLGSKSTLADPVRRIARCGHDPPGLSAGRSAAHADLIRGPRAGEPGQESGRIRTGGGKDRWHLEVRYGPDAAVAIHRRGRFSCLPGTGEEDDRVSARAARILGVAVVGSW